MSSLGKSVYYEKMITYFHSMREALLLSPLIGGTTKGSDLCIAQTYTVTSLLMRGVRLTPKSVVLPDDQPWVHHGPILTHGDELLLGQHLGIEAQGWILPPYCGKAVVFQLDYNGKNCVLSLHRNDGAVEGGDLELQVLGQSVCGQGERLEGSGYLGYLVQGVPKPPEALLLLSVGRSQPTNH